jgi:phosphate uptake regulator
MATREFMTITAKAEKNLKASIAEQIKLVREMYSNLEKFPEKKDYKLIVDIFSMDDKLSELNEKAKDKAIENFMKAPLGKDLRRNVAYLMVVRSLRNISKDATNIGKYINNIQGYQINKN